MNATHTVKVGVVQLALEDGLRANRDKIARFIHQAPAQGCRLVVFPEGALWSPPETPAAHIERAARAICKGRPRGRYLRRHRADPQARRRRPAAPAPAGHRPRRLGCSRPTTRSGATRWPTTCPAPSRSTVSAAAPPICADRWARGIEELPAFDGAQLLIECSCNWLREWVADLDHFWCAPRARRTGAYVVFSNTTRTWGGGPATATRAVFAPDGRRLAHAGDDPDRLLVATLDLSRATAQAPRSAGATPPPAPLLGDRRHADERRGRWTCLRRSSTTPLSPRPRSPLKVAAGADGLLARRWTRTSPAPTA